MSFTKLQLGADLDAEANVEEVDEEEQLLATLVPRSESSFVLTTRTRPDPTTISNIHSHSPLPITLRRANTVSATGFHKRQSKLSSILFQRHKHLPQLIMADSSSQMALFHHLRDNAFIKQSDENEIQTVHPNSQQLLRRDAIVPEDQSQESERQNSECSDDNVIIVPHVQISSHESHLFNRAISSGGGLLADLQRATMATQAFYAENEHPKARSPWILRRLYEWSNRAKSREIIKHVQTALDASADRECEDEQLAKLLPIQWVEMYVTDNHAQVQLKQFKEMFKLTFA